MLRFNRLLGISLVLACVATTNSAEKPVSYYNDVRPIFQIHCNGCHQPAKQGGSYLMTSYQQLFDSGDSDQPGIVKKDPSKSLLVQLLHGVKGRARMPKGQAELPKEQIELITRWVAEGALDDTPAAAKQQLIDADHPPKYQSLPVITSLAFSPDGELLAVAGHHEVLLHKADGSQLVGRLIGLSERIQAVAFSPDGKYLAVSGGDPGRFGEIQIWDVAKRQLRSSIPVGYDTVYGVSWSPDSAIVACGCADNTLRAFTVADGKQVLFQGAHSDWVLGTEFSQTGKHLISISRDQSVKLTEVQTNRFIDNVTSITPGALTGGLLAVQLRPTIRPDLLETMKAVALFGSQTSRINVPLMGIRDHQFKQKMAVVPNDAPGQPAQVYDEILVAGSDGKARLYKIHREVKRQIGDDANKIREFPALNGRIYALAFDPHGQYFAAGSSLDGKGEIKVFDVRTGQTKSTFENVISPVYTLSYHPNGKSVASAGFDGLVRLHDPMTGKLQKSFVPVPK
ncbi:MAG: c-type cytochrome domain-containing protein [Zavarzinella sp.]